MKRAVEHLRYLSQDKRLRREEEAREKFLRDRQAGLDYAFDEGFAKGMAEGEAEGRAEGMAEGEAEGEAKGIAKGRAEGRAEILNILQKHWDISTISKVTELSEEEIKNLKKKSEL